MGFGEQRARDLQTEMEILFFSQLENIFCELFRLFVIYILSLMHTLFFILLLHLHNLKDFVYCNNYVYLNMVGCWVLGFF